MDIEPQVISFLASSLEVPVYANPPEKHPEKFVTVTLEGGSVGDVVIEKSLVSVRSWAPSQSEAKRLARDVDVIVREYMALEPWVLRVTRESFYPWPSAEREPRYQATYQLTVYA